MANEHYNAANISFIITDDVVVVVSFLVVFHGKRKVVLLF